MIHEKNAEAQRRNAAKKSMRPRITNFAALRLCDFALNCIPYHF